jgi:hypothetical protein
MFQMFYLIKELKYISNYLPNNKCDESVDHHDHENEVEHLHQHRDKSRANDAACILEKVHLDASDEKNIICNFFYYFVFLTILLPNLLSFTQS